MKRTVSIKLDITQEQAAILKILQKEFARACNLLAPLSAGARCTNRVRLHHLGYYLVRKEIPAIGSQMACNAVAAVAQAYRSLLSNNRECRKGEALPAIAFRDTSSVHFDKRTYTIKGNALSLFTTAGRIVVPMRLGDFQRCFLVDGLSREAVLVRRRDRFFFNLVLDLPDTGAKPPTGNIMGVDLGENPIAAVSTGKLFGGRKLRHDRDKHLALRRRLQRNGSQSARQLLAKVSGREARHVRQINHEVSKTIVTEAVRNGCDTIALENLTNIRKRIRTGKRLRSRLHRWAWAQLQAFVAYKAEAAGIRVQLVNPAYTSRICSVCGSLGVRVKHRFSCTCGNLAHSDLNASRNLARFGATAVAPTGAVNRPHVETP